MAVLAASGERFRSRRFGLPIRQHPAAGFFDLQVECVQGCGRRNRAGALRVGLRREVPFFLKQDLALVVQGYGGAGIMGRTQDLDRCDPVG